MCKTIILILIVILVLKLWAFPRHDDLATALPHGTLNFIPKMEEFTQFTQITHFTVLKKINLHQNPPQSGWIKPNQTKSNHRRSGCNIFDYTRHPKAISEGRAVVERPAEKPMNSQKSRLIQPNKTKSNTRIQCAAWEPRLGAPSINYQPSPAN